MAQNSDEFALARRVATVERMRSAMSIKTTATTALINASSRFALHEEAPFNLVRAEIRRVIDGRMAVYATQRF